jgi:thiol:disulfide interchange protein DsbC
MKKFILLFGLLAASVTAIAHADDTAVQGALKRLGITQSQVTDSPVAGLKMVQTDKGILYITADGQHLLQGPMYDVSRTAPVNLTNQALVKQLDALQNQMIIYPAAHEKYVVTVFTDITCGYCHKLHEKMAQYNALGITIRYLAFPRQGPDSKTAKDMLSIWCTGDRRQSFDAAMGGNDIPAISCQTDISKHFQLGMQLGVNGTPAILLSNGTMIPGYQSPEDLLSLLSTQGNDNKKGG